MLLSEKSLEMKQRKLFLSPFLNSVLNLEGDKKIIHLDFLTTFQLPRITGLKTSIIDVKVKDQKGNTYLVEMQLSEVIGFDKRVQYSVSKEYSSQIEKGDEYHVRTGFKPVPTPVVLVGILEFDYFEGNNYLTRHLIQNIETGKNELKDISFNFIELPKFKKELNNCNTLTDKWIYFIKNAENLEVIPPDVFDEGLKEAYLESDKHNWTREELDNYDYFLMREQDERGKVELAEKKKTLEIAKNFKLAGVDSKTIASSTGLSIEEIEKL
jgi:predicted transposase/invertase (TIGR01784 family)